MQLPSSLLCLYSVSCLLQPTERVARKTVRFLWRRRCVSHSLPSTWKLSSAPKPQGGKRNKNLALKPTTLGQNSPSPQDLQTPVGFDKGPMGALHIKKLGADIVLGGRNPGVWRAVNRSRSGRWNCCSHGRSYILSYLPSEWALFCKATSTLDSCSQAQVMKQVHTFYSRLTDGDGLCLHGESLNYSSYLL